MVVKRLLLDLAAVGLTSSTRQDRRQDARSGRMVSVLVTGRSLVGVLLVRRDLLNGVESLIPLLAPDRAVHITARSRCIRRVHRRRLNGAASVQVLNDEIVDHERRAKMSRRVQLHVGFVALFHGPCRVLLALMTVDNLQICVHLLVVLLQEDMRSFFQLVEHFSLAVLLLHLDEHLREVAIESTLLDVVCVQGLERVVIHGEATNLFEHLKLLLHLLHVFLLEVQLH